MQVLHHVGIAVRSIDERRKVYEALGLALSGEERVPGQKVRAAFFPVAGSRIELLEPTASDSPIAAFLDKRGEGLHHLCFQVDDIAAAMERLGALGLVPLTREPQPGAHGARVCFLHPKAAGGVLIELWEEGKAEP